MTPYQIQIPSEQEIKNRAAYVIQSQVETNLITGAKAALYGIGIGKAILEFKQPREYKSNHDIPNAINTPNYEPDAIPNGKGGYDKSSRWDGYMSSSLSGIPVMSYVKFVGGTYLDLQGRTITIPDIIFETCVISITYSKRIIRSEIAGRDEGDVLEYIGRGNHQVEIRAIITSDAPVNSSVQKRIQNGVYPRDNMLEIFRLLDAPIALPVESWYLQQAGINYLVIEDGAVIEQTEGEYSQQRIILPCTSDNPLVINIKD